MDLLPLVFSSGWASGVNAYLVVLVLGLADRIGHVASIPDTLGRTDVLAAAAALYAVEFVADKIPYVDSVWDAVHTFIRPPAAAFLSYSAFADGVPEQWKIGAALLAGTVALTSHGAKATTRAAANVSPEPVSNWTLSVAEDSIAVFLSWLAATHPVLTAGVVVALVILAVLLIWRLFRFFRQVLSRFSRRSSGAEPAPTTQ